MRNKGLKVPENDIVAKNTRGGVPRSHLQGIERPVPAGLLLATDHWPLASALQPFDTLEGLRLSCLSTSKRAHSCSASRTSPSCSSLPCSFSGRKSCPRSPA